MTSGEFFSGIGGVILGALITAGVEFLNYKNRINEQKLNNILKFIETNNKFINCLVNLNTNLFNPLDEKNSLLEMQNIYLLPKDIRNLISQLKKLFTEDYFKNETKIKEINEKIKNFLEEKIDE